MKLRANGRVVAAAKLPSAPSWSDNEYPVYAGKTKLFSIWGDFFDCPLCLYAFADGKRFLCVDDDDTSMLVFVVDLRSGSTNLPRSSDWPPNGGSMGSYVRDYMEHRAPQVMNHLSVGRGTITGATGCGNPVGCRRLESEGIFAFVLAESARSAALSNADGLAASAWVWRISAPAIWAIID